MLKTVRKRIRIVTMNLVKNCDVEDCEPQCEEEKKDCDDELCKCAKTVNSK